MTEPRFDLVEPPGRRGVPDGAYVQSGEPFAVVHEATTIFSRRRGTASARASSIRPRGRQVCLSASTISRSSSPVSCEHPAEGGVGSVPRYRSRLRIRRRAFAARGDHQRHWRGSAICRERIERAYLNICAGGHNSRNTALGSRFAPCFGQQHSFAKSWADLGPAFMHGGPPLCTLIPPPQRICATGES